MFEGLRRRLGEYFENGVRWAKCLIAGAAGADQGDGQIPETGGAQEALVGNTCTPKTGAGVLEADLGVLMLVFMASLHSTRVQSVCSCLAAHVSTYASFLLQAATASPVSFFDND